MPNTKYVLVLARLRMSIARKDRASAVIITRKHLI